ncbi:hypothetical protein TH63_04310 [Rufibacter radiotolerans]|uniref:SH3b domain-containing protein n=1 Tax=Rufibacter radiotolerans TaxID=1379910 RepID=A0A0H4VI36_9BACT|nr:SH3 domain-containing protein [Rufibacter radiotolerans]AKQ45028.1 hypothetical protein TH63_04310 [Rufibacter radiotolerans]
MKRTENKVPTVSQIEKHAPEAKVDVFEIPTIKTLYVTNPKGSNIYEKPDKQSAVLETLEYGYKVEVIGEAASWYQIKERIGRSFVRNGQQIQSSGWEVVNIPKLDVGPLIQVKLTAKDLYLTSDNATINGKLKINLISKDEFEKDKQEKDKFIVPRNTLVSQKDTVLIVSTGNGQKKKYVSSPNAEESRKDYTYVGHSELLNSFLLSIGYYEGSEYMLYSSEKGEEIISFNDYPYISPDGRYIVSLYTNPYDQTTDFQLYKIIDSKTIKKELEASFSKWMAALEPQEIYWQDANTIVVKVLHAQAFWDEGGDLNKDFQYLQIKIL